MAKIHCSNIVSCLLFFFSENRDGLHQVVHEHLGELLRVLKAVINKHQTLNSVDILSAAGTVIAKVKGKEYCFLNSGRNLMSDLLDYGLSVLGGILCIQKKQVF